MTTKGAKEKGAKEVKASGAAPKKTTAKKSKGSLGKWSIKRVSDTELTLTLPKGMVITGSKVTIEDLLSAIATANALEHGRVVVKCCAGNMAIA